MKPAAAEAPALEPWRSMPKRASDRANNEIELWVAASKYRDRETDSNPGDDDEEPSVDHQLYLLQRMGLPVGSSTACTASSATEDSSAPADPYARGATNNKRRYKRGSYSEMLHNRGDAESKARAAMRKAMVAATVSSNARILKFR